MTILGIDLGTTSVKITIIDENLRKRFSSAKPTNAYTPSEVNSHQEQCPSAIFKALEQLLHDAGSELLKTIDHVSICCQMHGVVFWKSPVPEAIAKAETSYLVTWEDRRCDAKFIDELPKSSTCKQVSSGFGCATIFWLAKHRPEFLKRWSCAGTIGDLLVAQLCGLNTPVMSLQNAESWGYIDVVEQAWENEILRNAGFPIHLLPQLTKSGEPAGHVRSPMFGIPADSIVYTAMGDLQSSVFACIQRQTRTAVVNIGTSAQLVIPMEGKRTLEGASGLTLVPYFGQDRLAVAASLNGGNVLSEFVRLLQSWIRDLGMEPPEEAAMWERLCAVAEEQKEEAEEGTMVVATLFGERHLAASDCCAAVEQLRPGPGLRLGAVFNATCRGLMDNLVAMIGEQTLEGVESVVGTGSALRRNRGLASAFHRTFSRWSPTIRDEELDASFGAALAVVKSANSM